MQRRGSTTGFISTPNPKTPRGGHSRSRSDCVACALISRLFYLIHFGRPGSPGWPESPDASATSGTGEGSCCPIAFTISATRRANGPHADRRRLSQTCETGRLHGDFRSARTGDQPRRRVCGRTGICVPGLSRASRIVCLNTGGAFGPAKSWPVTHFGELARRLAEVTDASVLVLCGPAEREPARQIVAAASHPDVVSLADQPMSIGLTKACVQRGPPLITTDSGLCDFAAAFQTPVITRFLPDSHCLDSYATSSSMAYASSGTVWTMPAAGLPRRTSSVHARPFAGSRFSGGACARSREQRKMSPNKSS